MTTQTRNEAAERLRKWLAVDGRYVDAHPTIDRLVDEALTTERRATVERIRMATKDIAGPTLRAILDEEAAR